MPSRDQTVKRWIVFASITLVVLIGVIASQLWSESKQQEALRNEQLDIQTTLQSLVIERPGKVAIKIQKNENHWLIHEPCTVAVNEKRLQPLLGIVSPAAFSYAASEVDLDAAGLVNPLATIIANNQRIDVGNTDLSGERRYVKRGERVEFVPEWILPLLEGGLSALSKLEVVEGVVLSAVIEGDGNTQEIISADPAIWQQLTAQQIIPWPGPDNAPQQSRYTVTIKSDSDEKRLQIFTTETYMAIVFEGARCAYLLPTDALSTPKL